jgi:predicted RNA-binding protein with PUA-like domain
MPSYFLVKSDPETYGWSHFERDRRTRWDGVRNFQARNHLRAMKKGDRVLFYHSGDERAVVGVAEVVAEAYPDPTDDRGGFSAVDLALVAALPRPVTLAAIKGEEGLRELALLKQSRLSVMPVSKAHFEAIVKMGGGRIR